MMDEVDELMLLDDDELLRQLRVEVTNVIREKKQLADKNARYKAALEFYANEDNWIDDTVDIGVGAQTIPNTNWCAADRGTRARVALEGQTKIPDSQEADERRMVDEYWEEQTLADVVGLPNDAEHD